jgi:hypothetical protein
VVGDSKQMPPTNFFTTMESGEDEESVAADDELESILQECNASGVPSLRLKWHYRSRHESLIAFSNHHYYGDDLHTFPSPVQQSPELGVSFHLVEGAEYDRGGTRTNRVEAEAVVAEVLRRLGAPGASGSIGIVTFNSQQQGLIEDLLDEARRDRPEIERFFTGAEEPVFVKNLENVQGDERDTIIFSVGFGRDAAGRVSMNFGPLNAEGGERRLNVAITRARDRLLVFSSMQPDAIDLSRTRALGVRHFRQFLEFAQRGIGAMAEATAAHSGAARPSGFEEAVRAALVGRGWEVDSRVGCAGYRVDLAVRAPGEPGRYLLGIECDGPMYARASTARDRDRTRRAVLGGLGVGPCARVVAVVEDRPGGGVWRGLRRPQSERGLGGVEGARSAPPRRGMEERRRRKTERQEAKKKNEKRSPLPCPLNLKGAPWAGEGVRSLRIRRSSRCMCPPSGRRV